MSKPRPLGPMQSVPGTGGSEFFKLGDKIGWQASYTPEDMCAAWEVELAANNPVLILGLQEQVTQAQEEAAAKSYGKASAPRRRPRAPRAAAPSARAHSRAGAHMLHLAAVGAPGCWEAGR